MPEGDVRTQIRDFLVSRRSRVTPGDVGIPTHETSRRRVQGLRREEVAMLAGVSVEYYVRFERGDAAGASMSVINSIAHVLRLSEVEREHLRRLMIAADHGDVHTRATRSTVMLRPELQRLLEAVGEVPGFIMNKRLDIVGVNQLGRALYSPMYEGGVTMANTARFFFLNERSSHEFWEDWEGVAANGVAILRAELGTRPHDEDLRELIDELHESEDFSRRWEAHDVHRHTTGLKVMNHPVVGRLELPYENMLLPADPDLSMMIYNPAPGTPSADSLRLLAIWARDNDGSETSTPITS